METSVNPTISIGPVTFDLTLLAMSAVTILVVFGLVYWASRRMALKPRGKQNVLEYVHDLVNSFTRGNIGEHNVRRYSPFFFTLFTFILVANNLGLMTKIETSEGFNLWTSPTSNMFYDFGLAIFVTLVCHIEGVRQRGVKEYLKAFVTPLAMTPMNVLEEVTNLVSLALRLYGNIFSGEIIVGLLLQLAHATVWTGPIAFVINLLWTGFSVFISCLQAYVFTMLTSMYLGKKVNGE